MLCWTRAYRLRLCRGVCGSLARNQLPAPMEPIDLVTLVRRGEETESEWLVVGCFEEVMLWECGEERAEGLVR